VLRKKSGWHEQGHRRLAVGDAKEPYFMSKRTLYGRLKEPYMAVGDVKGPFSKQKSPMKEPC